MTNQDFIKGITITNLSTLSASQVEQLVDAGTPAIDKGLIIESTDVGGAPVVPNPATTPRWTRYLWKRITTTGVILYRWDDIATSVAPLLKWTDVQADSATAIVDSALALITATDAQNTAIQATADAAAANVIAVSAQADADVAVATADATATNVANSLAAMVLQLFKTGMCVPTLASTQYSLVSNEGWLLLNGDSVSKSVFATLFAAIGGVTDGPNNFFLPDWRGRTPRGAGTDGILTNHNLGELFGTQDETLLETQIPQIAHVHDIGVTGGGSSIVVPAIVGYVGVDGNAVNTKTYIIHSQPSTSVVAASHNNVGPSVAANWLIKT